MKSDRRLVLAHALPLVAFVLLAFVATAHTPNEFDLAITRAVQTQTWLTGPMRLLSLLADGYIPHMVIGLTTLGLLSVGRTRPALFHLVVAGGGGLLNILLKNLIGRPRPYAPLVEKLAPAHGYAFPSGHCAIYVLYFGSFIVLAEHHVEDRTHRRLLQAICLVPIVFIPLSRVYLGAHWASDTVASFLWTLPYLSVFARWYAGGLRPETPSAS